MAMRFTAKGLEREELFGTRQRGINAILCHIRKMTPTATIVNEKNLTRPMA